MDDLLEEMDCRSKPDAIVMTLLRSAMDKAHENVQSQNGPIEFLHKRSKFYELAAILVDCGLSIAQEEADIVETDREKMLSDLAEIKEWLRMRIQEMQLLITEKDRELLEREESELKLRHALELNERELIYLQEKLEFERELIPNPSNQERDDEICELKNAVDQQVLSIKQRLEDERRSLPRKRRASISCTSDNELYFQLLENNRYFSGTKPLSSNNSPKPGRNNTAMIQQMSSEIDILKGTLDLAFGRMQNADVFPLEKQWKWRIERDTLLVSLNGYIADIKERFKTEFEKKDAVFPLAFSREKQREFMFDIKALHYELKGLCNQINIEEKQSTMSETTPGAQPSSIRRTTSEPLRELLSKPPEKEPESSRSRYVARLVKNHESFIQKQRKREETNGIKREISRRNLPSSSSSIKKGNNNNNNNNNNPDELESRLKKVTRVLERLIKWEDKYSKITEANTAKLGSDSSEMRKLRQERDDLQLHISVIEEIFLLVVQGSMESLQVEIFNYDKENRIKEETALNFLQLFLESSVREEVHQVYFLEIITEWKMQMECEVEYGILEEEICRTVLNESFKSIEETGNLVRTRLEIEIEIEIGSILKEDIHALYLREFFHEWRTEKDASDIEELIKEEISQLFMVETMKDLLHDTVEPPRKPKRMKCNEDDHNDPAEELDMVDHRTEVESEKQHVCCNSAQNDDLQQIKTSISLPLMEFQHAFMDFERIVHTKLDSNCLRVDKLKRQINALARPASSLRKKKTLYKNAFINRCQNLSFAETEVDLLGDQVDKLLCLLQNIYLVLHQKSAVLSQYFGVFDILRSIKRELGKGAAFRPDLAA